MEGRVLTRVRPLQDHGERLLDTPGNPISIAITLDHVSAWCCPAKQAPVAELPLPDPHNPNSSNFPEQDHAHQLRLDQQAAQHGSQQPSPGPAVDSPAELKNSPHTQAAQLRDDESDDSLPQGHCSHCNDAPSPELPASNLASESQPSQQGSGPSDSSRLDHPNSAITFLGSKLFSKCVSGTRVIAQHKHQTVAGYGFEGYGSHCDDYGHCYLTAAAALGATRQDVHEFLQRLHLCMQQFSKQLAM